MCVYAYSYVAARKKERMKTLKLNLDLHDYIALTISA